MTQRRRISSLLAMLANFRIFGTWIIFLQLLHSLQPTAAYDCSYCHDDCSKYFDKGGSQFGDCVSANVHCNCASVMSFRNPLTIFIILFCIFIGIGCCCGCYAWSRRSNASFQSPRIVAEPVITPSPMVYEHAVVTTLTPSQESNGTKLPTEIDPPPSYHDVV